MHEKVAKVTQKFCQTSKNITPNKIVLPKCQSLATSGRTVRKKLTPCFSVKAGNAQKRPLFYIASLRTTIKKIESDKFHQNKLFSGVSEDSVVADAMMESECQWLNWYSLDGHLLLLVFVAFAGKGGGWRQSHLRNRHPLSGFLWPSHTHAHTHTPLNTYKLTHTPHKRTHTLSFHFTLC